MYVFTVGSVPSVHLLFEGYQLCTFKLCRWEGTIFARLNLDVHSLAVRTWTFTYGDVHSYAYVKLLHANQYPSP